MKIQDKIYSDYSFEKGVITSKTINTHHKILIADHCNIHNLIINHKLFKKKLITACEIPINDFFLQTQITGNVLLIAKNTQGYNELCTVINTAWLNYKQSNNLAVKLKTLINKNHLIILSGGYGGLYTKIINNKKLCIKLTQYFKNTNFNIEIQRFNKYAFKESLHLLKLGQLTHTRIYATTPVRYKNKTDFKQFRYKYCIQKKLYLQQGKIPTRQYKNNSFINANKKIQLFKDCLQYITDFTHITKHIKPHILKNNIATNNQFTRQSQKQLKHNLIKTIKTNALLRKPQYLKRINKELKIIKTTKFAHYFLTTSQIVKWAKSKKIQVGPGRGSCASSLIAYALKITDVDPIKHALIFERFLNKKKTAIPDFDIDFCKRNRAKVIRFIKHHNKHTHVLNIVTFNKFLEKNTLRDICRILGHSFKFSSKIINLIELQQIHTANAKIKKIIKIAQSITGKIKAIGTHAGGIIISKNLLPISIIKTGKPQHLSQFDKHSIEHLKLVKIDILGLNTLSIIKEISRDTHIKINFRNTNTTDKNIFKLLTTQNTTGIFQLEGKGITNFIKTYTVKTFKDLTNILAIYRPGPLNILKDPTSNLLKTLPIVKKITHETKGKIIFQEQIIQIIKKITNYSLNKCDILRKTLSKQQTTNHTHHQHFIKHCKPPYKTIATKLFVELKEITGYSFNKAHAVSYTYITYITALLKVYFKLDFFIALLNNNYKNIKKITAIIKNIHHNKIKLIAININKSDYNNRKHNNKILLGLKLIKGLGKKLIKKIIRERQKKKFKSIIDLVSRFKKHTLNKRTIQTLYYSGALFKLESTKEKCFKQMNFTLKYRDTINNYKPQQLAFKSSNNINSNRNIITELVLEKSSSGCFNYLYKKLLNKIHKLVRTKYLIAHYKHRIVIGLLLSKFKTTNTYEYLLETDTINIKLQSPINIFKTVKINTLLACLTRGMLIKKYIKLNE
ncbi:DUF655 domain-containing protein [Candidatus Vidania fulgoroideorum]